MTDVLIQDLASVCITTLRESTPSVEESEGREGEAVNDERNTMEDDIEEVSFLSLLES